MAVSKAQQACVNRYKRNHYARLVTEIPIDKKQAVIDRASEKGLSVNAYLQELCRADLGLTIEEWKNPPGDELPEDVQAVT